MPRHVLPGGVVEIDGAVDVEYGQGYARPWRLPVADLQFHDPDLVVKAAGPCGVRLRWRTGATRIAVELEPEPQPGEPVPNVLWYDLVVDGTPYSTYAGQLDERVVEFGGLPPGPKELELWLPHLPGVKVRSVRGPVAPPSLDTRPSWVVYGSSITHGLEATPSATWPAVAARLLGRSLTNMGFAGQCHLDPYVARAIAGLNPDYITLKLGINVHNQATLRQRTFAPLVHGFLATIRDHCPETPITVVSPIISPEREATAYSRRPDGSRAEGDLTLALMRDLLAEVVEIRRHRGDQALSYLDGRDLLGAADAGRMPDGLHPDAEGLHMIGKRYAAYEKRGNLLGAADH